MRTEKQLSKNRLFFMICAVMLMVASVVTVSSGVEAQTKLKASILSAKVTYDPGFGPKSADVTLPTDTNEGWNPGDKHKMEAPTCKDTNYSFMYWTLEGDTSGATYTAGQEYEVKADDTELKFVAVWGVKVTYDANLNDTSESITLPQESTIALKKDFQVNETLTATNYEFLGWSTEAKKSDATPEYKVGDTMKGDLITGPVKLYAIWKAKFLRVTYYANTGNESTDSAVTVPVDTTKYMGDNLKVTVMGNGKLATDNANYGTMKDATPTRSGYTFAGWATTKDATKAEYQPGATIDQITKDMDLYAVWTSGTTATTGGTTSGTSTAATSTTKTPQTGDNDHFFLYIVMAVLSLAGIGYLCYDLKKAKATK